MAVVEESAEGAIVHVKVVPGASRNRVVGLLADALKVQVSAPAEKGKANLAVARVLAKAAGIRRSDVELMSGLRSPQKCFLLRGTSVAEAIQSLGI